MFFHDGTILHLLLRPCAVFRVCISPSHSSLATSDLTPPPPPYRHPDQSNHEPGHPVPEKKSFTDQELFELIDPIIDQDDRNRDGYIDYSEFMLAQQNQPPPPPPQQQQQLHQQQQQGVPA